MTSLIDQPGDHDEKNADEKKDGVDEKMTNEEKNLKKFWIQI